ncbi:hypothetical protein [Leucobacter sp. W1478]|uniref:hypothetical protein n=1 Tax=Leucobacter sp. W1478 TaxID=3439065 RepID=UPI003F35DF91
MSAKTRLWVLITGVLCAFVVLYGVVAGLLPQLTAASGTRSLADNTALTVETQRAQLAILQQADADSEELLAELAELEIAIPVSTDWPVFLRELASIQGQSGALLSEFLVGESILPEPAAAEATAADPATTAEAAPTDPAVAEGTAGAAVAATGLVEIPITVTVTGTADQVAQFFRLLQAGDRLVFAQSVDIDSTGETTNGTLLGSVFVVPE